MARTQESESLGEQEAFLANLNDTYSDAQATYEVSHAERQTEIQTIAESFEILTEDQTDAVNKIRQHKCIGLDKATFQIESQCMYTRMIDMCSSAASDPFKKVHEMINNLITRLSEEAASVVEHKGWCDTELATNEQTRDAKASTVEKLRATVHELEASKRPGIRFLTSSQRGMPCWI